MKHTWILLPLFFSTLSNGQINYSKIDRKDLRSFIKVLTSDSLEGRGTGTEGGNKAARFISEKFNQLGLVPMYEGSYFEKYKVNQVYWEDVHVKTSKKTLRNFENMVFQGSQAQNEEISREVVFGGYGSDAELDQIEVKDRMVLVFLKNLRSYMDVNRKLGKRNAAGLIIANPDNDQQFESIKRTYHDFALQKRLSLHGMDTLKNIYLKLDSIRIINTITIPNAEIKNITGLSSKELISLVQEKRIGDFQVTSINVKFEKIIRELESANVVGMVNGRSDTSIVLSAHYDHLGRVGKEYFPGADDNASGVATLLELAEVFSDQENLRYNYIFLATSGEEAGLLGSYYHVNQAGFNPGKILCNVNIDMISRVDDKHNNPNYLYVLANGHSFDSLLTKAHRLYDKCSLDFSLDSKDPMGLYSRSDQYNFYKKGIPSIHFFGGFHLDYHQPTDTASKIDFGTLENRARFISMFVELLQNERLKK